jgi:hypothetical protein
MADLLFKLLAQMLQSSKTPDCAFGSQQKLLTEEKAVFDFIDSLNEFYTDLPETHLAYLEFLMTFIDYSGDSRSEAFTRKALQILHHKILLGKVDSNLVKLIMPRVFDQLE